VHAFRRIISCVYKFLCVCVFYITLRFIAFSHISQPKHFLRSFAGCGWNRCWRWWRPLYSQNCFRFIFRVFSSCSRFLGESDANVRRVGRCGVRVRAVAAKHCPVDVQRFDEWLKQWRLSGVVCACRQQSRWGLRCHALTLSHLKWSGFLKSRRTAKKIITEDLYRWHPSSSSSSTVYINMLPLLTVLDLSSATVQFNVAGLCWLY